MSAASAGTIEGFNPGVSVVFVHDGFLPFQLEKRVHDAEEAVAGNEKSIAGPCTTCEGADLCGSSRAHHGVLF